MLHLIWLIWVLLCIDSFQEIFFSYAGNFHFANIKKEDQAKSKYLCMTWHKELRSYSEGEDKIIEIHGSEYALELQILVAV